jgi:hypothetical protein
MKKNTCPERPAEPGDSASDVEGQRHWSTPGFGLLVLSLGLASVAGPTIGSAAPGECGLASPAFCDTFNQGPSGIRGRAGDLDPTRWSVGRLAPSDFSGSGVANPVGAAPIPSCRASFPGTSVYPPDDTLICDPSGARSAQLMTAVTIQNYGNNSYMIRQPFDFANRTGKIVFDVDAVSAAFLATFIEVAVIEDPVPAPTFREAENYETGPVPRNGVMLKWTDVCGSNSNLITLGNTLVYNNYARTTITPTFTVGGTGCPKTRTGFLNHFEIRMSQTQIEVYGSDYSIDNGQTFPNFRRIYAANVNLPFTRGYVHMAARNHASKKYGYGPVGIYHWDNIGFDGPVISNWTAYEIPDNTKAGVNPADGNNPIRNLGDLLLDGTTGKPAGIYDPQTRIGPFQFNNVTVTGAIGAKLSLNTSFNAISHVATTSWGLSFRFNGGTTRNRLLTATEVQAINTAGSAGNFMMMVDVPISDLRAGTNTLEVLPVNAPMDYPPVVANIDLIVVLPDGTTAPTPSAPNNLRVIR